MPLTVAYALHRQKVDRLFYKTALKRCSQDGEKLPNGRIGFTFVNRKDRKAYCRTNNPIAPKRIWYAVQAMIRYENRVHGFRSELYSYGMITGYRAVDFRKDDAAKEACKRSGFDLDKMYAAQ